MRILIENAFVSCSLCEGEEFVPAPSDAAPAASVRCSACGHEAGYDELFMPLRAETARSPVPEAL